MAITKRNLKIEFRNDEASALFALINWAIGQGYHPFTKAGKQSPTQAPARFAAAKIGMALGREFNESNH